MIDYLRESPTWRGVLILSAVVLVVSLASSWLLADYAAHRAFGHYVNRMETVLDRMEKITVSQTNSQQINVPTVGDQVRSLAHDIGKKRVQKESQ